MLYFHARLRTLRTLAIATSLLGLSAAQATACAVGHSINVFFDHVPEGIDGFVALEVTLVESHPLIDKTGAWIPMGRARIDKVINGEIDGKTVKLFRKWDECGMFGSGATHGIVVGTIREGTRNELEAFTEFQWATRAAAVRQPKDWPVPAWAPWPGLSGPSTPWPLFQKP